MNQRKELPDMDPILRKTLELCYKDPRSGRCITDTAGVSHMAIKNWKTNGGAQLVTLSAVLGALGYELAIVRSKPSILEHRPGRSGACVQRFMCVKTTQGELKDG